MQHKGKMDNSWFQFMSEFSGTTVTIFLSLPNHFVNRIQTMCPPENLAIIKSEHSSLESSLKSHIL